MLSLLAATLLALAVPVIVFAVVPSRVAVADRVPDPGAPAGTSVPDAASPLRVLATRSAVQRLDRSLQLANLLPAWTIHRVLRAKLIATLIALAAGALFVAVDPTLWRAAVAVVLVGIGYLAPDVLVASRARERQERIRRELPDALDQVTIAIEAGLGLETAIARASASRAGRRGSRSPPAPTSPTCAASPARSCRPISMASPSRTSCGRRRRSSGSSVVSGPRRRR